MDLIALVAPTFGIWILRHGGMADLQDDTAAVRLVVRQIAWLNVYVLASIGFDILLNLGFTAAIWGTLVFLYLTTAAVGHIASLLQFSPGAKSHQESFRRLYLSGLSFPMIYQLILFAWFTLSIVTAPGTTRLFYFDGNGYVLAEIPVWYALATGVFGATATVYPLALFLSSFRRAKASAVKDVLLVFSACWASWGILALLFFLVLGTMPPILGFSLPFANQIGFITTSSLFYLMALTASSPTGLARFLASRLLPQPMIKLGRKYLVLYDTPSKALSLFTSTIDAIAAGGTRTIISCSDSLQESFFRAEPRLADWTRRKKISYDTQTAIGGSSKGLSEKLTRPAAVGIKVRELNPENLDETVSSVSSGEESREIGPSSIELFLADSRRVPRRQAADFLEKNAGVQFLDLTSSNDSFSRLLGIGREQLQGTKILLEYDSSARYQDAVEKFLAEGIANAERCVLFTSKSSALYRALKGREMLKIVAASSLVSVPSEVGEGEVQIPNKELGLVNSFASDFLDNTMPVSFVFDSITELVRGDRWEQVYSGTKQLTELLSVPNATALFLANRDTEDPRFLGALRGVFTFQLRLNSAGLHVDKRLPT